MAFPEKPKFKFREEYETNPKFKAQVDESRLRRQRQQTTSELKDALATSIGLVGAKPKLY